MKVQFVAPLLHEIDAIEAEALCCSVWQDARPCDGVAALCDWRMGGRLSLLMRRGLLTGAPGEVVLVPGRPRLPFDKVLVFGAGPRAGVGEPLVRELLLRMLAAVLDLRCKTVALQLPGRASDLIAPERAAELFFEAVAARGARHLAFVLMEGLDTRRRIEPQLVEQGRRLRDPDPAMAAPRRR